MCYHPARHCFRLAQFLPLLLSLVPASMLFATPPPSPDGPPRPPRSNRQPPAPPVDVESMTFAPPELKTLFQAFDSAARGVAEDDWWHIRYRNTHRSLKGHWYKAEWAVRPAIWSDRPILAGPNRYVQVSASPGLMPTAPDRIRLVSVMIVDVPTEGWAGRCDYTRSGPPEDDRLEITFYRCLGSGDTRYVIQLPGARCGGSRAFGDYTYAYSAATKRGRGESVVRTFLESPDSFRKAALSELDALERLVREKFAKGELAFESSIPRGWDARDGAPPPMRPNPDPPSKAELRVLFDAALADVSRQRGMIRVHYRAMRAAVAWFPWIDCLQQYRKDS